MTLAAAWSAALRATALVARFGLVVALARLLPPADAGMFGLLAAAITYALYPLGLDFHVFSTREVAAAPVQEWRMALSSQLALLARLYLGLFLPAAVLAATLGVPLRVLLLVGALVVVEHGAQELYRLLVVAQRQVIGTVVLFLRLAAWVLVLVPVLWLVPDARRLDVVLTAWLGGGLLAVAVGLRALSAMIPGWWRGTVDWSWIARGVRTAAPFLLATLSWRGLFLMDRWLVSRWHSADVLGPYVLFAGLTSAILALQDAAILAFGMPELVRAHRGADAVSFRRIERRLWRSTSWLVCASAVAIAGGWFFAVRWLPPVYSASGAYALTISLSGLLFAFGIVPHVVLYATGKDTAIIKSNVVAAAALPISAMVARHLDLPAPVGLGLIASALVLLVGKSRAVGHTARQASPHTPRFAQ